MKDDLQIFFLQKVKHNQQLQHNFKKLCASVFHQIVDDQNNTSWQQLWNNFNEKKSVKQEANTRGAMGYRVLVSLLLRLQSYNTHKRGTRELSSKLW